MSYYPVIPLIEIICLAYFFQGASLWQLEFVVHVKKLKQGMMCSSLKGYCLVAHA